MATEVLAIAPIELPGGHVPMVEDTETLADLLERLAVEHTNTAHPATRPHTDG